MVVKSLGAGFHLPVPGLTRLSQVSSWLTCYQATYICIQKPYIKVKSCFTRKQTVFAAIFINQCGGLKCFSVNPCHDDASYCG